MISGTESVFRSWKYVDILSAPGLLVETDNSLRLILAVVPTLILMPLLVRAWWTIEKRNDHCRDPIWASTPVWALVPNVHVSIYDSNLAIASVLLTAGVLIGGTADTSTALI